MLKKIVAFFYEVGRFFQRVLQFAIREFAIFLPEKFPPAPVLAELSSSVNRKDGQGVSMGVGSEYGRVGLVLAWGVSMGVGSECGRGEPRGEAWCRWEL